MLTIRSKLGKSKRLAAFLCALLLTLETVAFPLTQAKAAATAALATVGFGVTTAAFLAACGIYPYWADDSSAVNFDWEDWVDNDLMSLVDQYNAANSTTPVNPNQVSALLSGATLLVGNYAWNKLCDFAEWIKTEHAVTDNQTGAELGQTITLVDGFATVPASACFTVAPTLSDLQSNGVYVGFESVSQSRVYMGFRGIEASTLYWAYTSDYNNSVFVTRNSSGWTYYFGYADKGLVSDNSYLSSYSYGGVTCYYNGASGQYSSKVSGVPLYASLSALCRAFLTASVETRLDGITADTSTVSIPDALPQGTEYGGLRVSGLPAATTAESVTDAVQDSVGERLKTPVEVVEVELAPGTEVDSETGAITQNPVVIEAPVEETIPALSALVPAQEFIQTMTTALQTKFPFCLPFDFMRLINAVAKSPEAPVITMTFFDRIGGGHYTITVDLSPWDDIAAIVRRLEAMILFLGFWLNFDKFNMLNVLLGQIG